MIPRLLFDLTVTQPSFNSKRHGGGIYGEIVLRRILQRGLEIEIYFDSTRWLNPQIKQLIEDYGIITYDRHSMPLQQVVEKSNCDRVYTCGGNPEFRSLIHPLKFYTLHGMRELETPLDNFYFKYNYPLKERVKFKLKQLLYKRYRAKHLARVTTMIETGTRFVVVSNHTANSIKSFVPGAATLNIPVFYSPSTTTQKSPRRARTDKYFLIVSANRWEKNALRAIIALDRAFSTPVLDGYKAVITGAKSAGMFKYKLRNPERFEFKGYVEDDELNQLYHDAYALIYPSLNEGFGYPPLEAMHYGVPVLASPYTSIPEVCGDAVIYFNPLSVEEIMSRILMITNPATHADFSARGSERYDLITARQKADLDKLIDFLYD